MAEVKGEGDGKLLLEFKEWVAQQPQLPKDFDDRLLLRFLHSCYYDIEKTKTTIQMFCQQRSNAPELLNNRDPNSDIIQKNLKIVNLAHLKISGNRNLWIWQLNDPGLDKFDYVQDARLFFLSTDSWLLGNDDLEEEDIVLMDVKDISLKFLTKFNMSVARKLSKYQEEAMPIRLKQIHLVNAPPFIDKIFGLIKPFMKQDHVDMINFHAPNSETLNKFFTKDELPVDYGGTNGKMEDHMKDIVAKIMAQREHLLKDDLWKMIDTKKSKGNKAEASTEIGSFRSLAID